MALLLLLLALLLCSQGASARTTAVTLPDGLPYDWGTPASVTHIWVDPSGGSDSSSGDTEGQALRTMNAAWDKVPKETVLTSAYHIHIKPGSFSAAQAPDEYENVLGTYAAPVIFEAVGGPHSVTFNQYIYVRHSSYIYFVGIDISFEGDEDGDHPFHGENVTGLLLRGVTVRGSVGGEFEIREAVKVNQCKGVYFEECDFAIATDNAIDAVGVQYGHLIKSELHDVGFGVYFKGGSAYIIVSGNRIHHTGELGMAAGFDTGFEFMVRPWIRFEAYDVKVYNNIIHDVDAPGISVQGGFSILYAFNTLYRTGKGTSTISVRAGVHGCDGGGTEDVCLKYHTKGGWGPPNDEPWTEVLIPNNGVIIANNLVLNPPDFDNGGQHFYIAGPQPFCSENSEASCKPCKGLPAVVRSDRRLFIKGNLLYNGVADMPLGFGPEDPDSGCQNSNRNCNVAQVAADNAINTLQPQLVDPEGGDFRPTAASLTGFTQLWSIPAWDRWYAGPKVPQGNLLNEVLVDFDGTPRTAENNAPGAFVRASR